MSSNISFAPKPVLHRAGVLIRRYRAANSLSLAQFAELLAARMGRSHPLPRATVDNWERYGKVARADVQRALVDMKVCGAGDWLAPAPVSAAQDAASPSSQAA